jgi:glycosyltransferase involved in cell wall biosynthesis
MKTQAEQSKISIITPSFNQAQYLERTIQSVLDQNYPDLEYIIIDGGSVDGSVDVIKKYEKNIAFWVSEKDGGQTDALNKGFKKATGEIIGWQNSDDIYLAGSFEKISQVFNELPDTDIVFGDLVLSIPLFRFCPICTKVWRSAIRAAFGASGCSTRSGCWTPNIISPWIMSTF